MDLSIFEAFGWRGAIILTVVAAAIYLLLTLLRLLQLGRSSQLAPATTAQAEQPLQEPHLGDVVTVSPALAALVARSANRPAPIKQSSADSSRLGQEPGAEQPRAAVPAELRRLRVEVVRLRDELTKAQETIALLKNSRNAAPLYSKAMGLAQQGQDAETIAELCGISIARAEMLLALNHKETGLVVAKESEGTNDRAADAAA